ncbi:MAG: flippase-like domain-containing protein [Myxococcota bacterium]|nr:flippase-like domain-containing protein [Myxococcota bacterium]MDW8361392.1 lysylphosphatidylglycerol synthase transmembrane domain-containing protein [Myxococcales bacterium]
MTSSIAPDASEQPPSASGTGLTRRVVPKLVLSVLLGALFAWLVLRGGVPLVPGPEAFASVQWWTVPAYAVCVIVTHLFRASRWRFLVRPVRPLPFGDVVALNWIGFFAIFALPLRLGELARPALSKLRCGVPLSAGFGTVAVERVVDGLVTSLCVLWALFALPMRPSDDPIARALPFYGVLSVAVFAVALVAIALFLWQRRLAARLVASTVGLVSPAFGTLLAAKVGTLADGLRSIAEPRLLGGFLAETVLYWGTNAAGMWLLGWGCGLPMDFGHAVAVMGILAIGILLPAGPGLFGNFQLAVATALKVYFAESVVGSIGAAYILLMYATQAVIITLTGVVPLYVMRIPFGALLGQR